MGTFLYTRENSGGERMSRKYFNQQEQKQLANNPHVLRGSEKSITYAETAGTTPLRNPSLVI